MPKKKLPPFCVGVEDFKPFAQIDPELKAGDLIRTQLGLVGKILGVKYLRKGEMDSGVLWVEYKEGFRSPLETNLKGYSKCPLYDHIWHDVESHRKKMLEVDEAHYVVHELNKAYRLELIEEDRVKQEAAQKKMKKKAAKKPVANETTSSS